MAESSQKPPKVTAENHLKGLNNFDSLPNSAHVKQRVVEALFAIQPSTVHKWVKEGRIPAPKIHLPKHTAWNVGDLRKKLKEIQAC